MLAKTILLLHVIIASLMVGKVRAADIDFTTKRNEVNDCAHLEKGIAFTGNERAICVSGYINDQRAVDFLNNIRVADKLGLKISEVVISGPGGSVEPAIIIAREIKRRNLDTVVGGLCASSCAQFLFVAGKQKFILSKGVVVFHGGPIPESQFIEMNLSKDAIVSISRLNEIFRQFYKDLKLNMDMLTKPPKKIQERINAGEIVMWSWSVKKLHEFGVEQVYEEPQDEKGVRDN